jgi:tetratricopeptide (TPR) repeat protein
MLVAKRRKVNDSALRPFGVDALHETAMSLREMTTHDEHVDQPFEPRRHVGAVILFFQLADELADRVAQVRFDLVLTHPSKIPVRPPFGQWQTDPMRVARSIGVCGAAFALIACAPPRTAGKPAPAAARAPAATVETVVYIDPDANQLPSYEQLTTDELAVLEGLVARGSTNCVDHARLAAHYGFDLFAADSDAQQRRLEQLMWLAEHCPTKGQQWLLSVWLRAAPAELVVRWEEQVKAHPESAEALGNLAALVDRASGGRALDLYERAEKLEPRNPRWPEEQSKILARGYFADFDDTLYHRAYAKLARAVELYPPEARFDFEAQLAEAARRAGDLVSATKHANKVLAQIDKRRNDFRVTGDLIYGANVTLGRIALQKGDVSAAKRYLIAAAKTPGSPVLDSFGPDMTLAQELLARGEQDIVLQYFDLVEKFWEGRRGDLDRWRDEIRRGVTPRLRDH